MYADNVDITTTLSLQPTSTATSVSTTTTTTTTIPSIDVTEVSTTETLIVERAEFIVAMIIVALVVILILCVVMLCFVRPKQGLHGQRRRKQPLTLPPYSGVLTPSSTGTYDFSAFPSEHGWIPNQPPVVGNYYYNHTMKTFLYRRALMIMKLFYKDKGLDITPHTGLSNGLTHSGKMIMLMQSNQIW